MQTEVLKKKANRVHKNTGSEAQSHTPYIRSLSAPISALIPLQDSRSESCAADVRGSQGEQKLFESFILIIQFSQTKPKTHLQPVLCFHYISRNQNSYRLTHILKDLYRFRCAGLGGYTFLCHFPLSLANNIVCIMTEGTAPFVSLEIHWA